MRLVPEDTAIRRDVRVRRHIRPGYRDDQADTLHESLGPSLTKSRGVSGKCSGPHTRPSSSTSRNGSSGVGIDKLHGNLTHPFPTMRIAQNAGFRKQTNQSKRGWIHRIISKPSTAGPIS